jgi:mediator of RNA polymerase II transcription subunit 5
VVGWLCDEIERQGILSGVHLNVLQTLVLDSAFPEPLLRANARAITRLLDPATGLEPVMLSSSFDAAGVRARIDTLGGPDGGPVIVLPDNSAPLVTLRAELANVQHLDLAPAGWEARLYDALDTSLRTAGALPLLEGIVSTDILYPPTLDAPPNSPEVQFLAFVSVLSMPRACAPPLAVALVDSYLPFLFTQRSPFVPLPAMPAPTQTMIGSTTPAHNAPPLPFASHALHHLLRNALLAADAYAADEGGFADYLASHLSDEFACQRVRPAFTSARPKRAKVGALGMVDALCAEQKELICELVSLFEGDDEIRSRWPNLTPMSTMGTAPATGPAS